jgi:hypothetical protein
MTGVFPNLEYLFFLIIIDCIIFPILSLVVINLILDNRKIILFFRIIINLFFGAIFFLFQQNLRIIFPDYFIDVLLIESLGTMLILVYLIFKIVKIWRN